MKKVFLIFIFLLIASLSIFQIKTKKLHWDALLTWVQNKFYQLKNTDQHSQESRIDVVSFNSAALNDANKQLRVYLPEAYDKNPDQKFPVLYLLHGFPGNNQDWLINTNLQTQLDDLISQKLLAPLIVVFPDGNGPIIRDSQYINATLIDQEMESYILDVVNYIDNSYRTINQRQSRAIGGMSSGAYGAVNVGLKHNDLFSVIISHSGYFLNREKVTQKLLADDPQVLDENNPLTYIDDYTYDQNTHIYMDIGKDDYFPYFIDENSEFDQKLTDKGIQHEFNITNGSHNWDVWKSNIKTSLIYLGNIFK